MIFVPVYAFLNETILLATLDKNMYVNVLASIMLITLSQKTLKRKLGRLQFAYISAFETNLEVFILKYF